MNKREIGADGEERAVKYLEAQGFKILETNYVSKIGEIDIIGKQGDTYVFIEVKYRKDNRKGRPYEAVNYSKQLKIMRTAMLYAQKEGIYDRPIRFDVVEIIDFEILWITNAFMMTNGHHYL